MSALPNATVGQVVHTRPSPEEYQTAGEQVRAIRRAVSDARSRIHTIRMRYAWTEAHHQDFRDAEGMLTGVLRGLYEWEDRFPQLGATTREQLAHPETFVVVDGFSDERQAEGFRVAEIIERWAARGADTPATKGES